MTFKKFICWIGLHRFEVADMSKGRIYCDRCGRRWGADAEGMARELKPNSWTEFVESR